MRSNCIMASMIAMLFFLSGQKAQSKSDRELRELVSSGNRALLEKHLQKKGVSGQLLAILRSTEDLNERYEVTKLLLEQNDKIWGQGKRVGSGIKAMALENFSRSVLVERFPELAFPQDAFKDQERRLTLLDSLENKRLNPPSKGRRNRGGSDIIDPAKKQIEFGDSKDNQQAQAMESLKKDRGSKFSWIIAGVLLVGILALLFKVFKGKSNIGVQISASKLAV